MEEDRRPLGVMGVIEGRGAIADGNSACRSSTSTSSSSGEPRESLDEKNEKAALRIQASLKGYRNRRAYKEIETYLQADLEESALEQLCEDTGVEEVEVGIDEEGIEETHSEDGGLSPSPSSDWSLRDQGGSSSFDDTSGGAAAMQMRKSFSECSLQTMRTIGSFMRKRILREAALIGKGMTRSAHHAINAAAEEEQSEKQEHQQQQEEYKRKKVCFLSSRGEIKRESLDIPSVQSIPLKKKHWLEALDAKHRYGSNLALYYEVWKDEATLDNFFYWLDHGLGRAVELVECPRKKLDDEVIKYCTKQEREKYEVVIRDGILAYRQTNVPVHTMDTEGGGRSSDLIRRLDSSGGDPDSIKYQDTWIFVCSPDGKIYVGKKRLHPPPRFQHSSFLAGGAALAAGQMDLDNGKVVEIRAFSGHYRPKRENLLAFLQMLHQKGVDTKQVRFRQFKNK
jgi:hypothetical protein